MYSKMKTKVQILALLLLAIIFLSAVFLLFPISTYPPPAAAQEPDPPVSLETLEAFGLTLPPIQAASGPFDLGVTKTAMPTSVDSGDQITYTIRITNSNLNPAEYVFFYDDIPAQMEDVAYQFSRPAISNGLVIPTWLFTEPIGTEETVYITITGILTSAPDVTVVNTAIVTGFFVVDEQDGGNNRATASVDIEGSSPFQYLYLPIISKFPPPPTVLVYHEDFNSGEPWAEFDSNGCKTETRDGKFWVDVDRGDRTCLPPANDDSYRTYGEFEVLAYHSEGLSNAAYGIFINGQGGDNYYLFRIWPNNGCSSGGDWELIRRRNGNNNTIRSGDCASAINRGGATNLLKIAHESNRTLSVYVNDTLLDTYPESSSNHLTGEATGVYVRSANEDVRIKFDDFKVYRFN